MGNKAATYSYPTVMDRVSFPWIEFVLLGSCPCSNKELKGKLNSRTEWKFYLNTPQGKSGPESRQTKALIVRWEDFLLHPGWGAPLTDKMGSFDWQAHLYIHPSVLCPFQGWGEVWVVLSSVPLCLCWDLAGTCLAWSGEARKLAPSKASVVFTWDPLPGQSSGGFFFEPYPGSFFFELYLPLFWLLMFNFPPNIPNTAIEFLVQLYVGFK